MFNASECSDYSSILVLPSETHLQAHRAGDLHFIGASDRPQSISS